MTSLALRTSSRTHFDVLGLGLEGQVLGLEASSPRKLACPRLEDSSIFWIVKILWSGWKIFLKTFFRGDRLKNFCEDLFFYGEHLRLCPWSLALASSIPVLGLESVCPRKGCPWPWPRIFFVSLALALASSLVSSTPPLVLSFQPLHSGSIRTWVVIAWNGRIRSIDAVRRSGEGYARSHLFCFKTLHYS